jgi:hypothetical protein
VMPPAPSLRIPPKDLISPRAGHHLMGCIGIRLTNPEENCLFSQPWALKNRQDLQSRAPNPGTFRIIPKSLTKPPNLLSFLWRMYFRLFTA